MLSFLNPIPWLAEPLTATAQELTKNHSKQTNKLKNSFSVGRNLADSFLNAVSPGSRKLSDKARADDKAVRAAIVADLLKKYGKVDPKLLKSLYNRKAGTGSSKAFDNAVKRAVNRTKENSLNFTVDATKRALVVSGALGVGATGGYAVAKYLNKPYINPTATALLTGLGSGWLADYMYRKFNTTHN